ncbi:MAG: mechanosensitive ion channel family protein [Planctomycetota bacterium]|jgi:MscS family membrane protein
MLKTHLICGLIGAGITLLAGAAPAQETTPPAEQPATTTTVIQLPTTPQPADGANPDTATTTLVVQTPTPTPAAPVNVPEEYNSPHATVATFLSATTDYVDAKERDDEAGMGSARALVEGCLDLGKVNPERAQNLAQYLLGILNRLGEYDVYDGWLLNADDLARNETPPTEVQYYPSWRWYKAFDDYEDLPDVQPVVHDDHLKIVLVRGDDGAWRFSADTVAGLYDLYRVLKKMPVIVGVDEKQLGDSVRWIEEAIETALPEDTRDSTLLTLEYWQWIALILFIFTGNALDFIFRRIVSTIVTTILRRQKSEPDPVKLRNAVRPAGLMVMALFWLNLVWILELPDLAYTIIQTAAELFAILASVWALWRLTDVICDAWLRKSKRTENRFDDVLVPLVRKTAKIVIFVFGVIYIGLSLDIELGPLIAGLGIGGLGFAFAAKDTIENFFGSATVLIDHPFGIGDWIVVEGVEGTVESIGFRSTRVRTFYNSLITVPNATLVRATVDNYGKRKYRRYKASLGVEYGTPPEKILAFTEGIREIVRTHPYMRRDYFHVYLNNFGPASLDILLYVFFETPDWSMELREKERFMLDIIRLADRLGVEFAFPTQKLHLVREPDAEAAAPLANPGADDQREAERTGIRSAQTLMRDQPWQSETPGPVDFPPGPTSIESASDDEDTTNTEGSEIENTRDGA